MTSSEGAIHFWISCTLAKVVVGLETTEKIEWLIKGIKWKNKSIQMLRYTAHGVTGLSLFIVTRSQPNCKPACRTSWHPPLSMLRILNREYWSCTEGLFWPQKTLSAHGSIHVLYVCRYAVTYVTSADVKQMFLYGRTVECPRCLQEVCRHCSHLL